MPHYETPEEAARRKHRSRPDIIIYGPEYPSCRSFAIGADARAPGIETKRECSNCKYQGGDGRKCIDCLDSFGEKKNWRPQ